MLVDTRADIIRKIWRSRKAAILEDLSLLADSHQRDGVTEAVFTIEFSICESVILAKICCEGTTFVQGVLT